MSLIEKAMRLHGWEKSRFLIDGFPRNTDNLQGWQDHMGDSVDLKGV